MTRFAGYAAIFDRPDKGGDVIRKGAFAGAGPGLPLFAEHDPARRIGTVEHIAEDERGLRIIATAPGQAIRKGHGLSFGYRVTRMRKGTYRELNSVELIEVSLVTHPMQPHARVLAVQPEGDSNGL